jgi:hypothetical protein
MESHSSYKERSMPSFEATGADEPHKLTPGDRTFLGFSLLVTLVRVAAMLGAAFSFLLFSFNFDTLYFLYLFGFVALYAVSTFVMTMMLKRSSARAAA